VVRTVTATRYVTPLREGGSLPAVIEADDGQLYVVKFRGAGQGPKALIAELLAGEIGRALALPVPEIVFVELDTEFWRSEPDPEIQDLLRASAGLNMALAYLPGALAFEPLAAPPAALALASAIVWFDAYVTNVDRTARNTNMLMWHRQPWLIDHGATLYFHHSPGWESDTVRARTEFPNIKDHVLLRQATLVDEVDERMASMLTRNVIDEIVARIPEAWLPSPDGRLPYERYLLDRLAPPRGFVRGVSNAR
jgi:hypothetical protein